MIIPVPKISRRKIMTNYVAKPTEFGHTYTLTGAQLKIYKTPVVYIWKRGEEWLYVGCSYRGMQRITDTNHHVLDKVEDSDTILMMYNLTTDTARTLEIHLIRMYKPKYNKSENSHKKRIVST